MRSVRILIAVLFIARRLHELHARPVGIQLICHDSRQRRAAPASHLRAVRDDVRGSIRADRQVHVGVQRRCGHCVGSASIRSSEQALRHQAYAQHKRSGPQHALQESTPAGDSFTIIRGNIFDLHHAPPLCSSMRIDVKPLRVTLYPTAVPVSCKPARPVAVREGESFRASGKTPHCEFAQGSAI